MSVITGMRSRRFGQVGRRALRLAEAVATPLVPQDYLDVLAPLSGSVLRGRIEEIRSETREAATLMIRPGRGWTAHRPGQHVRLGVDVDGVRLWRTYSLTSVPGADDRISITVKAVVDGAVSSFLVHRARPGTIVQLDTPTGAFVLPRPLPPKLLFITAGSGVTPVMGMLRSQLAEMPDVVHVHAAPNREDAIFGEELRRLDRQGDLRLIEHHSNSDGRLRPEQLTALVDDLTERETYACGPAGLLETLEVLYAQAGAAERLHIERFRPQVPVAGAGEGGPVTFARQGRTVKATGDRPILTAGEDAGVLMPSGCRMGICFGCVVPLVEGAVRDLRTGEITYAETGDNVQIQTCCSAAAGPCRIDL